MSTRLKSWIVAGVIFLFLMTASGNIESVDGVLSLEMARNWVESGRFEPSDPQYGIGGAVAKLDDGRYISSASKGLAVVFVPAVLWTKFVYDRVGYTSPLYFPLESDYLLNLLASFVNPILGIVFFVINWNILSRISKNSTTSLIIAILISLTTNLWPLSKHSFPNFLVTVEMSVLMLFLYKWFDSGKWRYVGLALLTSGLMVWSYNLSAILAIAIAGYWIVDRKFYGKKLRLSDVVVIGVTLSVLAGVVGVIVMRMGGVGWIKNMLGGEGLARDWFQAVWGMLLSPGRSVTVFSPLWGMALILAFVNWRKSIWSRVMILGVVIYVGFYSLFDIWSGELSFGPRYLAPLIPLAGFVLADNWNKTNKKWLIGLSLFGLYVQMVGVTVPYETQYQGMNVGNFNESSINSRQEQFDYWSLGEFLPKYSPIYRLKKNLVHRWLLVPKYFERRPDIVFAGGATLPIEGGKTKRLIGNNFKLQTNIDLIIENIRINNLYKGMNSVQICANNSCEIVEGKEYKGIVEFGLREKMILKMGDKVEFGLFEKDRGIRYELTSMWLNDIEIDIDSYKIGLEDGFYNKNTKQSEDREVLYQRYYDRKAVVNMTADFWWVRQLVYFR